MKKGVRIIKGNYIVHCNHCDVNYIICEYIGRCLYCGSANVSFLPLKNNISPKKSWLKTNGFKIGVEIKAKERQGTRTDLHGGKFSTKSRDKLGAKSKKTG